jgi:hypothetical protein
MRIPDLAKSVLEGLLGIVAVFPLRGFLSNENQGEKTENSRKAEVFIIDPLAGDLLTQRL